MTVLPRFVQTRFGTLRAAASTALSERTPRERLLLAVAAMVAVIAGGYAFVWAPVMAYRDGVENRLAQLDRMISELASAPADVAASAAVRSDQPPAVTVTETAAAAGLILRRLDPDGDSVRLALEDADFANVLLWIETLERDHGLRAVEVEMTRRPAPGLISATLTLRR